MPAELTGRLPRCTDGHMPVAPGHRGVQSHKLHAADETGHGANRLPVTVNLKGSRVQFRLGRSSMTHDHSNCVLKLEKRAGDENIDRDYYY